MVDLSSNISGDFGVGFKMTCILQEGAITVNTAAVDITGNKTTVMSYGAPLAKGDLVMLDAGAQNTYAACKGLAPVKKLISGAGPILGRVVSNPKVVKRPSVTKPYTDSNNADWGAILAGEWYRIVTVEIFGAFGAIDALCLGDGANPIVVGATATIIYDFSDSRWKYVASGGSGVVNCHHIVATANDYTTLLLLTGFPMSRA